MSTFQDLPTELIEWVLSLCGFTDLLRCQMVCRRLRDTIRNSSRLAYDIDLGIFGYTDEHVNPNCTLETRRRMLDNARRVWNRPSKFELVESLNLTYLSYWPVREGILLFSLGSDPGPGHLFDVRVFPDTPGPPTEKWQVRLPVPESGILWIDPRQDLVVIRAPVDDIDGKDPRAWFSCCLLSLRTGQRHPLAQQQTLHVELSERVQTMPHYTRVQTYGSTLAVSTANGIQLFTEMAVFNWHTGQQLAHFSSPVDDRLSWGDTGVFISPNSFLLNTYCRPEQTCHIGVYAIDPGHTHTDNDTTGGIFQVATYTLPRMRLIDFRALLTPSLPQRIASANEKDGYFTSSRDSMMMRVFICNTRPWEPLIDDATFFTPLRPFLDAAESYLGLLPDERRSFVRKVVPWRDWERNTRWLTKEGSPWMQDIRRGQRGLGSRYAFTRHIVDFSPLELARAVAARRRIEPSVTTFENSETDNYNTVCREPAPEEIMGRMMIREDIHASLPYREKMLPELVGFSPDSDWHLIGDKLVSVEGGLRDRIKIYQLVSDEETKD